MENALRYPHLRTMELLKGMPDDQRTDFLNRCTVRSIASETLVLTQGQQPDGGIIVAKGVVEVSYVSDEGHRAIIGLAHPTRTLGMFETVANRPCAASCTAFAQAELLYCPASLLKEYLKLETFLENYSGLACDMLNHDNTFKAVDQFFTAEQKICRYLGKFAGNARSFKQNQSYFANAVGCTRQTVNKELSFLREHDIISIVRGEITILDPAGLEQRIKDLDDRKPKKPT